MPQQSFTSVQFIYSTNPMIDINSYRASIGLFHLSHYNSKTKFKISLPSTKSNILPFLYFFYYLVHKSIVIFQNQFNQTITKTTIQIMVISQLMGHIILSNGIRVIVIFILKLMILNLLLINFHLISYPYARQITIFILIL